MRSAKTLLVSLVIPLILATSSARAQGILLPKTAGELPKLIKNRIRVSVNENIARVTSVHVFVNQSQYSVEGLFYLPLPRGAVVTDLSSEVNGRTLEGKILGSEEAERMYEEIVRRDLDPALLQLLDYRLLKLSVYPLEPGKQARITVRYEMELPVQQNTVEFRYPLRTDIARGRTAWNRKARLPGPLVVPRSLEEAVGDTTAFPEASIEIEIESAHPIGNIYSPAYEVDVRRLGERQARISASLTAQHEGQFVVYWSLARGPMAVTALAQRERGKDGYFLLSVAPAFHSIRQRIPLDVAFVLDVSGSMEGSKIAQAKNALLTCLDSLDAADRFALVTFSNRATVYSEAWLPATERMAARKFIEGLAAEGGTNLYDALRQTFRLPQSEERLQLILLLTDGRPTAGETRFGSLVRFVQDSLGARRLFGFGVGSDVNAVLLDKIAEYGRGFTNYIGEEEIAEAVERFFARVRNPVLSDLRLDLAGSAGGYDVYPPQLPDLFYGAEVRVAGRYRAPGSLKATLRGKVRGKEVVYHFDLELPSHEVSHPFVPRVWAARKIGFLLDQIRMNGESEELVHEVQRLGKEFGLVTPYTSYLAQEPRVQTAALPGRNPGSIADLQVQSPGSKATAFSSGGMFAFRSAAFAPPAAVSPLRGVQAAAGIGTLKRAETVPADETVRFVAGRTFVWRDSVWQELRVAENPDLQSRLVQVHYGSPAFFWLFRHRRDLRPVLSLGKRVAFLVNDVPVEVGSSGIQDARELRRALGM